MPPGFHSVGRFIWGVRKGWGLHLVRADGPVNNDSMLDNQLPSGTHLPIFNVFPPCPSSSGPCPLSLSPSRHSLPSQLSGHFVR
jgi:hypothetical protein